MRTLLFYAKGFETMEFSVFIDVLGWARDDYGYDVMELVKKPMGYEV